MTVTLENLTAEQMEQIRMMPGVVIQDFEPESLRDEISFTTSINWKDFISYKNYQIVPTVMCFDIRYVVYGEGLMCNKYKTVEDAKHAIDKYLAKAYVHKMLKKMSEEADVSMDTLFEALAEMLEE